MHLLGLFLLELHLGYLGLHEVLAAFVETVPIGQRAQCQRVALIDAEVVEVHQIPHALYSLCGLLFFLFLFQIHIYNV